jgi:hypothetical protein
MTDDILTRLRERTTLRYAGNCKCGSCQLVPRELIQRVIVALDERDAKAADEIEKLRERSDDWRAAMTENHDLWRENERLRGLVEHYAARAFGGAIVAADEQYPWIANAMKAITALEGEKTND